MFIVIESIVGGGKKHQMAEVSRRLRVKGFEVIAQDFPDRAGILYESVIFPAQHEDVDYSPIQRFMIFMTDMLSQAERIKNYREKGYFVSESYFTSTLAYQIGYENALKLEEALQIAEYVKLPKPDLTIYIDTPYEKALEHRKLVEGYGDKEDFWGRSVEMLEIIDQNFKKLIKNNIFCDWEIMDGAQEDEKITENIIDLIEK
jgi:thymidylate kinase